MKEVLKIPTYAKFIHDIINNKISSNLEEHVATISRYPFDEKILAKLVDPGTPTISCSIGEIDIRNTLCDICNTLMISNSKLMLMAPCDHN